ncbi:rhodanese-like domain-containing protein [Corallococcus sp. bb12-1]|uniref:rhodanese-like domain-containing protein n=1 Tax=Corallococcus sp. bb12-1 TaxID=2996784 RepID=UPI00226E5009|nr:rhodanese-like domain-containing protein [Corallococcus sp. bb12-1]MCY1044204.1 rhodanese-like domain-containing protein [Corallococcus sp. bb12-1]
MRTASTSESHFSFVLETPAATPEAARLHFQAKLSVETDAADLRLDLERGRKGFVVVDVRSAEAYARRHIPGALHIPGRQVSEASTAALSKDDVVVVYCWGPGCNGATKAAVRFAALGFRVKELLGGIEYWVKEGASTEGTLPQGVPVFGMRGEI